MPDPNELRPSEGAAQKSGQDSPQNSPTLFDNPGPGHPDGHRRRDLGIQAAYAGANIGWRLMAESRLELLISERNPFTAEDLRALTGEPLDTSHNIFGVLIAKASREGRIVAAGFSTAARPTAHGRILRRWRAA